MFRKILSKIQQKQTRSFICKDLDFLKEGAGNVVESIQENPFIGYRISNVLTDQQIDELIQFESIPSARNDYADNFRYWPNSMYAYLNDDSYAIEKIGKQYQAQKELLSSHLSFDLEGCLFGILSRLYENKHVCPKSLTDNLFSPFVSFRNFGSGSEALKAHCENIHLANCESQNNKLGAHKMLPNCLSYFIVLQSATGGDLNVYDISWQQSLEFKQAPKDNHNAKKTNIPLKRGDLFVFAAGEMWHEVEPVISGNRITIGSFFGHGSNNELEVWI